MSIKYTIICCLFFFVSCVSTKKTAVNYHSDPAVNFTSMLQKEVSRPDATTVGVSLTVLSPKLDFDFSGAAGFDSVEKDTPLQATQPFRIASLTKTFVAVAVLRLREKGLLSIDDPITNYISKEHISILKNGGYTPEKITLRQCMMHTSGLFDYAEGGPDYIAEASKDPSRRWTRTEQLQFAMDHGKPQGLPGTTYHYSDTGYILLGETIEKLMNTGLAEGLRILLKFEELGMSSTWLESLEEEPAGLLPHVKRYMGDVDASTWDNSVDLYGGGGLASTTRDVGVFIQALFNNQVFEKEGTLEVMLLTKEFTKQGKSLPEYRLGIDSIIGRKSGIVGYLHSGFWGTVYIHFPVYNCTIVVNDTNGGDNDILQAAIDYVQWLDKELQK
ncbi:serine hydrolase domain-containing protein [Dokdonia sp.]|uniref:serine hydrolase domain-containing protein n=1 Tax=Dokdonia sp. TaxID=2024995 RepID=UPI0032674C7B